MNQTELPRGFLRGLLADRSMTVPQIESAVKNAHEVRALCAVTGHPAAELIHRRATMAQARAAISAATSANAPRRAMAAAHASIKKFAADFWAGKNSTEADDEERGDVARGPGARR